MKIKEAKELELEIPAYVVDKYDLSFVPCLINKISKNGKKMSVKVTHYDDNPEKESDNTYDTKSKYVFLAKEDARSYIDKIAEKYKNKFRNQIGNLTDLNDFIKEYAIYGEPEGICVIMNEVAVEKAKELGITDYEEYVDDRVETYFCMPTLSQTYEKI